MELIYKERLIQRRRSLGITCLRFLHGIGNNGCFEVAQSKLRLTVITLYSVLIRKRSPVKLELKLSPVCIRVFTVFFKLLHKITYKRVMRFRHACGVLAAAGKFTHFILRPSASVAEAER